jgi:ribosomal protein L40E
MKSKTLAIPLIILLALTFSCKKTVESQQKAFESNLKKANELIFEYPSFAELIKKQIAEAETVVKEAEAITDEKSKIEKIGSAVSILRTKFISNLDSIQSTIKSVKSKSVEVRALNLQYNERMSADQAISNGETAINNALEKLKSTVNNQSEAEALSGLVLSSLRSAEDNVENVIKIVKEREAGEKKAAQEKIDQEKAASAKVEAEKAEQNKLIKCSYCGTENPVTAANCKNCGAPIKK